MPDTGLLLVRLFTGFFMIYHGMEVFSAEKMEGYLQWDMFKDSSSAKMMVYAGKGAEFIGGILLFIGLFTRIACIILIATMGYITFFVSHGKIWYEDQHPFMFVLIGLLFLFTGPGTYSLDAFLFNRKTVS